MLRYATLLVLLVITWTHQAASSCGDKCSSKEHSELYSLLDKTEAAINKILHSENHKKIVQDINKKMKSRICDLNLNANEISDLVKVSEGFLDKIEDGSISEKFLADFLDNDPMKHLDSFIEKIKSKGKSHH